MMQGFGIYHFGEILRTDMVLIDKGPLSGKHSDSNQQILGTKFFMAPKNILNSIEILPD